VRCIRLVARARLLTPEQTCGLRLLQNRKGGCYEHNYWDDDEEEVEIPDHQLDGDALVKKLRKAKRADEKRIKELTDQLDGYVKQKREQTVIEVLAKKE
jgi:hypothetical protein